MALSSSSSILPFSNFSGNPNSSKPSRSSNALSMVVRSSYSDDSALLLQVAKYTVDSFVENGMVIGLGSGRASGYAIQYLGRQIRSGAVKHITGVATSVDSASEAAKAGVPLGQYRDSSKTILKTAGKLVLIVTAKQYQGAVEGSIPVLIESVNWLETAEEIDDLFLGDAEVWRRSSIGHAGPLGGDFPLVTKEGHNVVDVIFTSPIQNLAEVGDSLDQVAGVVEHGARQSSLGKMGCGLLITFVRLKKLEFNYNDENTYVAHMNYLLVV
ncbi:probable ribose-5-phosphate isomerase 4, chloroplastic isoform X3 [Salvia miltiorrhiza]|uniref:probable ribose-5-phosphate isomerase 4, chloroplastic isoform X3 n=1 Tax=Salvia miltiorrhiza TaxID=226208 RepID=UPI0025AC693C|nr:probable ribose-5-phosphate isomerase 4, chloroplastic isoform X3 [Salvia miltiorrhiza]